MIWQIAQKSHDLPTRNDTWPLGRESCLVLATARKPLLVRLLQYCWNVVRTTFWQIVNWQIVISANCDLTADNIKCQKQRFFAKS